MNLSDLVRRNRSYRRFDEARRVPVEELAELIALARLTPSGMNKQYLKYSLVTAPDVCAQVFDCLHWASFITNWDGPAPGERPAAYIVVLRDMEVGKGSTADEGIAEQTILLGAAERGLGGCILGSVKRERVMAALGLSARYEIAHVLALGVPAETVVIDDMPPGGAETEYYRDGDSVHHVPKRALEDLIV